MEVFVTEKYFDYDVALNTRSVWRPDKDEVVVEHGAVASLFHGGLPPPTSSSSPCCSFRLSHR